MPHEIERKFLIRDESWRKGAGKPSLIRQAYLAKTDTLSLRVRIWDETRATLTVKAPVAAIKRLEFEYAIPLDDALMLFNLREGRLIEKLRYHVHLDGLVWEIDVFQAAHKGLMIAEVELPDENTPFARPAWLGEEVTADARYSNARLAQTP